MTKHAHAKPVLVLVHPGSACGSANFNLGRGLASSMRACLVEDLDAWQGGVVVIDGGLSDEIPQYAPLDKAITNALERAQATGHPSYRVFGCDEQEYNQVAAARDLAKTLDPSINPIALTGAWYDPDGDKGCVNSVYDVLAGEGFSCDVLDSALSLDDALEEEPEEGPHP